MQQRCVIIGGGHAGAQVVTSLRKFGWQGEILMLSNELNLPYHRPPLSKSFLLGNTTERQLLIRPEAAYEKENVDVILNTEVRNIHPKESSVMLQDGSNIHYSKLVLCTGSKMRRINVPGANLAGIFYIKTIEDIRSLNESLMDQPKTIVMVGGGYVSLETAAVLKEMNHSVTVLARDNRILSKSTSSFVAEHLYQEHQKRGVNIFTNKQVSRFVGDNSVASVECSDGSIYKADIIVVGIGADADCDLARDAGLDVGDGIVIDAFGRTSCEDIYAAGDCTYQQQLNGVAMQIASVPNALEQAKCAASTICGEPKAAEAVQWFWSDQYDCKVQMSGLNYEYDETVLRQNKPDQFSVWYLKEKQIIAAEFVNSPADFMMSKKLIDAKKILVSPSILANTSITLKSLLAESERSIGA